MIEHLHAPPTLESCDGRDLILTSGGQDAIYKVRRKDFEVLHYYIAVAGCAAGFLRTHYYGKVED